jgi:hypothetical protein
MRLCADFALYDVVMSVCLRLIEGNFDMPFAYPVPGVRYHFELLPLNYICTPSGADLDYNTFSIVTFAVRFGYSV